MTAASDRWVSITCMSQPERTQRGGRRKQVRASRVSNPLLLAAIAAIVVALGAAAALKDGPEVRAADLSANVGEAPAPTTPVPEVVPRQKVVKGATLKIDRARQARLRALRESAESLTEQEPAVFRVGSFNILGSQHTAPGGTKGGKWPSGAARLGGTIERIRSHGVSVVGLQEAQPDQLAGLVNGTGFAVYPSADANPLDRVNSVIYDPGVFELVSATTFEISNGRGFRPQPVLRLRHLATDREVYVVNAHPPAGHDRATTAKRIASQSTIVRVVNDLKSEGLPILLVGDMNDREAFYQRVVRPAGLIPSFDISGRIPVDWVVGTPDIIFSDYLRDESTISRRISDHFYISATATIGAND